MSPADSRERLRREAIRLLERYHVEVIERFGLCPWAKHARSENRTRTHVVTEEPCLAGIAARAIEGTAYEGSFDVAFVVAPLFTMGPEAFGAWCTEVALNLDGRFLAAPFHPVVDDNAGSVRFFRQTPDPTLQLVRRSVLDRVRAQDPPHYQDIFKLRLMDLAADKAPKTVAASVIEHNERVLEGEGRATIQAIVDDIRADRERTYAGLVERAS